MDPMRTSGARWAWVLVAAVLLAACSGPQGSPPAASTIDMIGLISDFRIHSDGVAVTLENGQTWEGLNGTYRTVMDWGAKLLVVGHDAEGVWIATLGPQGGLPDSCYFTPEPGTEWGDGIAIGGVLWPKASSFSAETTPSVGSEYPGGTRFCLDGAGQVTSVIPR
jgi:hypothetical protein